MTDLEARYRRLFAAYPAGHRRQREDEMVAVLLDLAEPDQQRPSRRQAVAIVGHGLACRARDAEEWRLGIRLAGLASVTLATALATVILGIALLPPIEGPSWTSTPGWVPVAVWSVALAAALTTPWLRARGGRHPVADAVTGFGLAVVVLGADVGGAVRPLSAVFAVALVLSVASPPSSARWRGAAALAGLALGVVLIRRLVDRSATAHWGAGDQLTSPLWTEIDRWILAYDAVGLRPAHWSAAMGLGLVGGLVRPRFAVATGILAVPLGILARARFGTPAELLPSQLATSLGAMGALFALALVLGRVRRRWTPHPADGSRVHG